LAHLQSHPEDVAALDQLAFIYMQLDLFNDAKVTLEKAIALKPDIAELHNHLGGLLLTDENYQEAEAYFKQALKLKPDYAEAYNNYGLLFYKQKAFKKAEKQFRLALEAKRDCFDAMYNLALSLKAQDEISETIACLLALTEADHKYIKAYLLLADLLIEQKLFEEADKCFQNVLNGDLNNTEILIAIIKSWLDHKCYKEAKKYCVKALSLRSKDIEILYNLGVIETFLGEKQAAINHYHAILQIDFHYFPALNNLAVLYLEQQSFAAAKYYFQQALKQKPDDKSIQYILNAISGDCSYESAPREYVEPLFDGYADHFEQHLCETLNYCVPELLKQSVMEALSIENPQWNILDLGCGTGLCGKVFEDFSKYLVGIDVSSKMIEVARQDDCYNELIAAENLEYLIDKKEIFDLITAADVFVYQGNLSAIFSACYKALLPESILAFSTEIYSGKTFAMQQTGRFCHAKCYIETLASEIGFKVLISKQVVARQQQNQPIQEYLFILQK